MAKALIGYMSSDLRNNARMALEKLVADNRALRARIAELEDLVVRLQDENDERFMNCSRRIGVPQRRHGRPTWP